MSYSDEWRRRDAKLAEAMGFTVEHFEEAGYCCLPPAEKWEQWPSLLVARHYIRDERALELPHFHADTPDGEWAKRQLLVWLNTDQARMSNFVDILGLDSGVEYLLLATPAQVAEAAAQALGLE